MHPSPNIIIALNLLFKTKNFAIKRADLWRGRKITLRLLFSWLTREAAWSGLRAGAARGSDACAAGCLGGLWERPVICLFKRVAVLRRDRLSAAQHPTSSQCAACDRICPPRISRLLTQHPNIPWHDGICTSNTYSRATHSYCPHISYFAPRAYAAQYTLLRQCMAREPNCDRYYTPFTPADTLRGAPPVLNSVAT